MSKEESRHILGRYRLGECKAEGPLGRLYKGVDERSGQKVLIRMVDPVVSRNERIRNVLEDLRDPHGERRLHDASVLRILDVGVQGEAYCVVFEDFPGLPLDEFLGRERLPLREALQLARLIAESVRAVHSHKIVHGDIKPRNVLVTRNQQGHTVVKLALADLAHATADGMVAVYGELVGTPKYLSPEQIEGKCATPGSDVFSLGVLFYELFSGKEPFPSQGPLGYLRANAEAEPLSQANPEIPSEFGRVVDRMLARDPRGRYRTVQALLDDIEHVEAKLDGEEPAALPGSDSAFAPPLNGGAGNVAAWRAVAIASLAAAAILLIAVILMLVKPGQDEAGVTPVKPVQHSPGSGPGSVGASPRVRPSRQQQALAAVRKQAGEFRKAGRYDEALRVLERFYAENKSAPAAGTVRREIAGTRLEQAEAMLRKGRDQKAGAAFRRIARDFPGSEWASMASERMGEILLRQADVHESRGELDKAVRSLEGVVKNHAGSAAAQQASRRLPGLRVRLGKALTGADPERAVAVLENTASRHSPKSVAGDVERSRARALIARADKHLQKGRFEQSLKDYRTAYRADPSVAVEAKQKEAKVLAMFALHLKGKGQYAEALAKWNDLAGRYPTSIWLQRGKPRMQPLLSAAEKAGTGRRDNAAILVAMAEEALKAKDRKAWRNHLEQAIRLHPDSPHGRRASEMLAGHDLAEAIQLGRKGDSRKAVPLLAQIMKRYPKTGAGARAYREHARWKAAPEGMVYVPGGEFTMGLREERAREIATRHGQPSLMVPKWFGPQRPERRVNLAGYYIDRLEVTNEQYRAFVAATGRPAPPSTDWSGDKIRPGLEKNPVVQVTWEDAAAYARWAGKRLPTEADWEKAARGIDGRLFPWGDRFDAQLCVTAAARTRGTLPVGSKAAGRSPYGCEDMIGNVLEWTQSNYVPYPAARAEGLLFNKSHKVARGAGYDEVSPCFCLCTTRVDLAPDTRLPNLGFRCAKDAD